MAIGTPSESPAIVTREIDLSGVVPNVQSTTGVSVGNFRWGPVNTPTRISNETQLAARFGGPDETNTVDFHTAAYYLRYSSDLQVVRSITSAAKNAYIAGAGGAPTVLNLDNFIDQDAALAIDNHTVVARYPGVIGSSISVQICPADSATFNAWAYRTRFDGVPSTSAYAAARNASNDEVHIAVIDADGTFTGVKNTVLETFSYVSLARNARNADGSTNYAKDIVNNGSQYIYLSGWDISVFPEAGNLAANAIDFGMAVPTVTTIVLQGGVDSALLTPAEYAAGFNTVSDVDTIQVDFLIAPSLNSSADQVTVVNNLVSIASSARKDCVVVASPARSDVIGTATPVTNTVAGVDSWTKSSYLIASNNFLKIYDKYNDQYIFIPDASSIAGLMAATDYNAAPWFSPAGQRRGNLLGITGLSYSPTKAERDTLYKAGVNPVANIPGQGILLFGDKTKLARPSAFDRINVRRLFLVIERAIALAARNVMFEFNDEFTRAEFVNIVEPFLREIKGRRGITDFKVVCDETNNTAAVIDRNEFIANIFIKPARSINYVTLNFVAVRTGVDFEEVVGTV